MSHSMLKEMQGLRASSRPDAEVPPLLLLDPRALCSTHKCFLISFPSGSEA